MIDVPIDVLKQFPVETTSGDNGECVGFSVGNVIGNISGHPMDIEFSYAAGLYMSSTVPETNGEDPEAAMAAAVVFGALPLLDEGQPEPQLYAANFANYTPAQKSIASQYAQNGILQLTSYTAIANYILQYQKGAIMAVSWYDSFNTRVVNGVLPMPLPGEQPISSHCVAAYDSNAQGLIINAWTGQYLIMPLSVFNVCFVEAFGFLSTSWRWLSLVKIALKYPRMIPTILPLLSTSTS